MNIRNGQNITVMQNGMFPGITRLMVVVALLMGYLGVGLSGNGEHAGYAIAQTSDVKAPDVIVKETTEAFLADVEQNKDVYKADNEKLYAMVKTLIEENLDTQRIGRLVLGKHWRKASEDERTRFLDAFRNLMIKTYATAIFEYEGQPISYRPLKIKPDAEDVVVKTDIDTGQGRKVPVNYSMGLSDGTWKIFDVNVSGVSLVTSYRASYGREVKRRGMEGLISALEKKAAQRQ